MTDGEFKILNHSAKGFEKFSDGKQIQKNFSPDSVLKKDDEYILIEHETEPNRKTIVADVFKAAYFLQENKKGILVIAMTPKGKSSFESYPNHVIPYFQWLKQRTNLTEVFFIREKDYCLNGKALEINGAEFRKKCTSLNYLCKK